MYEDVQEPSIRLHRTQAKDADVGDAVGDAHHLKCQYSIPDCIVNEMLALNDMLCSVTLTNSTFFQRFAVASAIVFPAENLVSRANGEYISFPAPKKKLL